MLLFVVDAQLQQIEDIGREVRQRPRQRLVDMGSIISDLVERGAAEHSPAGSFVARSFGLVIAVEQIGPAPVEGRVAGRMVAQDESFEEPGGMSEMPFRRRSVRKRLDRCIRVAERCGEIERQPARRQQPRMQRARARSRACDDRRSSHLSSGSPGYGLSFSIVAR